ncbi:unnamed protein product, partial [Prunus brigantina]
CSCTSLRPGAPGREICDANPFGTPGGIFANKLMVETRAHAKLKNKATKMTSEAPKSTSPVTVTETEPTVRSSATEPVITDRTAESAQEQAAVENLMDKQANRIETSFMAAMDRFSSELRTLFQERMPQSDRFIFADAAISSGLSHPLRFGHYSGATHAPWSNPGLVFGTDRPDHNGRAPRSSGPATKAAERRATKSAAGRGPTRSPSSRASVRGRSADDRGWLGPETAGSAEADSDAHKLRLFVHSLTGAAFSWFINLPPNSVRDWSDMESTFHEHFYQTNREITFAELARMSQATEESPRDHLQRFKTCRNWCRTNLPEREFIKMVEEGLEFEYRKKFQGIELRDMHDLINKVDRYASLLKEEVQKKAASKGTYYRNPIVSYAEADGPAEAEKDEVDMSSAEVNIDKPFICKGLVKTDNSRTKVPDAKFAARETKAYTFDLTRAEAIFDLLLSEKKVKLSFGHKIPKPEELKGKTICKYHSSWSHNTNNCLHIGHREERRPANGKGLLVEPKPVLCSRCEYEIGRSEAAEPPLRTFKPPVVRDDRWYRVQHGGNVQPLTKTQLRRMQRQAQQAREQVPRAERTRLPAPIVLATKSVGIRAPRVWRPRKNEDLGETNRGIIDVYRGRDPPFSTNGLSSLKEFHKDHSAVDLYGLTPENREIIELALKNTKAEGLLITKGSDSAIKAVYQANREAKARGAPGYHPDQKTLEDEAPFGRSDLEYLRQYFSMTPVDVLFGLTIEEKARVSRL